MLPTSLSFVDIETTSANPISGRVIEIGILRIEDNQLVKTYNTLINPQTCIDPFIENMTGITQKALEHAPTFEQVKDEILDILNDSVFVAHNVRFDYGFLRNEYRRFGQNFSFKHFCSVKLARLLYPGHARYNLDTIIERFDIPCENRHRAFDDAKVLWDFYQKALKQTSSDFFEKAVNTALKRPTIPLGIATDVLDNLPQSPGVYIFYGDNDMPLYIGKSINIHDRILSHFSSDHLSSTDMKISQQIQSIETIQTAGELGALFLESTLIKKQQPLFNRKLRNARKLIALKKTINEQGYNTILHISPKEVSIHELEDIIGIFTSQKEIKNFLYELCKNYGLCPKLCNLEKGKGPCFSYHLAKCFGGCIKKITPLRYNLRFEEAFYNHKIKPWPFNGPIVIKEKTDMLNGSRPEEYFLIDKWCFLGNIKTPNDFFDNSTKEYEFDFDTYKILRQYLGTERNLRNIQTLSYQQKRIS